MPVFCDAYFGDTMHLSLEEHGAYLKLLMVTWRNNGTPLVDDNARLARMLGITVDRWRKKLRPVLEPFFDLSEGTWRQARLEKEWRMTQKFIESRRENGKKGGRPNSLNSNDRPKASADPTEKLAESSLTQPKKKDSEAIASEPRARRRACVSNDFDEWWLRYPHKVGKEAARKAFDKARRVADQTTLLVAITRYEITKPPDRAWCNPATWLNQGRWQDEPATVEHHGNGQHRQTPGEKLWEGFARAAETHGGVDRSFAEPLLDSGRSPSDEAGPGRRLAGRPH